MAALVRHRVRLAKAALVLAVLGVAGELFGAYPREVDLALTLGPDHRLVRELRVAYVQDGQELHGVRLSYPDGAPEQVRHRVRLGPGRYELRVELNAQGSGRRVEQRTLQVPTEGTVQLALASARR